MRKLWLCLVMAAIAVGLQVRVAQAEQTESFGKLVRALAAVFAPAGAPAELEDEPGTKKSEAEATHAQLKAVEVKGERGTSLQTLACSADGKVIALVALPRYGNVPSEDQTKPVSEVRVFDGDGNPLTHWPLNFSAQSVAVGPDGVIYVAGDGKLAKFDSQGKILSEAEVPHLAEVVKDQKKLRKQAEEQMKQEVESFAETKKTFQDELAKLKKKDASELSELEKQQIQSYEANIESYEEISKTYERRTIEQVMEQLTSRLRLINGISVTDKDVFIACGELKGFGYAIWRMDIDFKQPKQVLNQVGGCCGQMDVQARGNDLYVAENTRHRIGHYDRDGKLLGTFGKKSRESEGAGFGGCCNPMNCRIASDGVVYTAESEGVVKKFSAKGEFVSTVGVAKLTGGCKNVAVAASPKGDRIYFCDLPGSRIIILGQKTPARTSAAN